MRCEETRWQVGTEVYLQCGMYVNASFIVALWPSPGRKALRLVEVSTTHGNEGGDSGRKLQVVTWSTSPPHLQQLPCSGSHWLWQHHLPETLIEMKKSKTVSFYSSPQQMNIFPN